MSFPVLRPIAMIFQVATGLAMLVSGMGLPSRSVINTVEIRYTIYLPIIINQPLVSPTPSPTASLSLTRTASPTASRTTTRTPTRTTTYRYSSPTLRPTFTGTPTRTATSTLTPTSTTTVTPSYVPLPAMTIYIPVTPSGTMIAQSTKTSPVSPTPPEQKATGWQTKARLVSVLILVGLLWVLLGRWLYIMWRGGKSKSSS